jgi:hypothetical protein
MNLIDHSTERSSNCCKGCSSFKGAKLKTNIPPDNVAELLDADIRSKEQDMKPLLEVRQKMVKKLKEKQSLLTKQEKAFGAMQSSKAASANSLELELFKILKGFRVEQSSYHGGSLNGKDIKKLLNNTTYLFNEFSSLLKSGKQDNCELEDNGIDALCKHFMLVFVLWDGAFSLAWKKNPMTVNSQQFQQFVKAAVIGHVNLGLKIAP